MYEPDNKTQHIVAFGGDSTNTIVDQTILMAPGGRLGRPLQNLSIRPPVVIWDRLEQRQR